MPQCEYITEKGTRYTRQAITGSKYCYQHHKIVQEKMRILQAKMPTYFTILPSELIMSLFSYFSLKELPHIISELMGHPHIISQYDALRSNDFWSLFWKRHVSSVVPAPPNAYEIYKGLVEYLDKKPKIESYDFYYDVIGYLIKLNYDILLYAFLFTLPLSERPLFYDAALYTAALPGHKKIVEKMLKLGATDYNFALEMAARGGHIDIVKLLLAKGANNYATGLGDASREGHMDIVKLMLEKGATNYTEGLSKHLMEDISILLVCYWIKVRAIIVMH